MKKNLWISVRLTLVMIVLCSFLYPFLVALVAKTSAGGGDGEKLVVNGKVVGYANIGQRFNDDRYFWGRPSAIDYNAAGSGGSNKGPSNPGYLLLVQQRIDTFLAHNPAVKRSEVTAEMITASGSGLDPDISPVSAYIQVKRVAGVRSIDETKLKKLVDQHIEKCLFAPDKINVLKLNIALNELK
jgi:K+-transporting ATPase ATPase C chain